MAKQHQDDDVALQQIQRGLPASYLIKKLDIHDVDWHVDSDSNPETQWDIFLTEKTVRQTIH